VPPLDAAHQCGRPIPLAQLRVLPEARDDAEYEEEVVAGKAPPVGHTAWSPRRNEDRCLHGCARPPAIHASDGTQRPVWQQRL